MLFTEGRGGVTELTEWVRHVDDLVAVSPPPPPIPKLGREESCKAPIFGSSNPGVT